MIISYMQNVRKYFIIVLSFYYLLTTLLRLKKIFISLFTKIFSVIYRCTVINVQMMGLELLRQSVAI